jgi:hypothetical protein
VALEARANPNLNGFELERLTFGLFRQFVSTNVDVISVTDGRYSMKLYNNRGKTDNWVGTPVLEADIPVIIQNLPPSFLVNPGSALVPPEAGGLAVPASSAEKLVSADPDTAYLDR